MEFLPTLLYTQNDSGLMSFMGECGEEDAFHTLLKVLHKRKQEW